MSASQAALELLAPLSDNNDLGEAPSALPARFHGNTIIECNCHGHSVYFWLSPDGKWLVTRAGDFALRVWDVHTMQMKHELEQPGDEAQPRGHSKKIDEVLLSSDSRLVAARTRASSTIVWSLETGATVLEVVHDESYDYRSRTALSSDSMLLATSEESGVVRVYNIRSGAIVHELDHPEKVGELVFSPSTNTRAVLGARAGNMAFLWAMTTGELVCQLEESSTFSLLFAPHGDCIVTCSHLQARVWTMPGGELLHILEGYRYGIGSVSFSPDGSIITARNEDKARIWETASGKLLHVLEHAGVGGFSPDGKLLATYSYSRHGSGLSDSNAHRGRVWEVASGELLYTIGGHTCGVKVHSAVFSSDSSYIAVCEQGGSVLILDAASGAVINMVEGYSGARVAFTRDGTRLICTYEGSAHVWDLAGLEGELQYTLEDCGGEDAMAVTADGSLLAHSAQDKTVRVVNAATGETLHTLDGNGAFSTAVAFSPDGRLLLSGASDSTARLWSTSSGELVQELPAALGRTIVSVAFAPGGEHVAIASRCDVVQVWDVQTGKEVHRLGSVGACVGKVKYSPDGALIASMPQPSQLVLLWSAATGEELRRLQASGYANARCFAFSPDSSALVMGYEGGTARVWDVQSGEELHMLKGHEKQLIVVEYAPGGGMIATTSHDKTVRLWDAASGAQLHVLRGHTEAVFCMAFEPSGKRLVSGGDEVRVWSVDADDALYVLDDTSAAFNLAFSSGGRVVAHCGSNTIRVWLPGLLPSCEQLFRLWSSSRPERMVAKLEQAPVSVQRRATRDDDGGAYYAGESVLHMLARGAHAETLQQVVATNEHASPLQPGPKGTPLLLAAQARNDRCVRVLLDEVVRRASEMGPTWMAHSGGLSDVLPVLARSYPRELTEMLERMELPAVHDAQESALQQCANVQGMREDEVFRTSARHVHAKSLWWRYFDDGDDAEQEALLVRVQRGLGADGRRVDSGGTDVEATVVPVRGLAGPEHAHKPVKQHPIGALLAAGLADALGSPVMNHVLAFKWNRYARDVFLASMRVYVLLLALFTLATLQAECYDVVDGDGWWRFVRLANDGLVVLLALHHLRIEARQLRKEGVGGYLSSVWNFLDVVGLVLILALVPFRVWCWAHASTLQSVAAVCLWLKLLDFFRAFRTTGPFVRMIFRITSAVGFFLMVLGVVLVAFSHGLFLIFRDVDAVQTSDAGTAFDYGSWWVLVKVYQVMLGGDFDRTELSLARSEGLAVAYVVAFSAFATILMLNLLIALMGSVYAEVEANVENEWLLERAQIVLDIDQYMSGGDLREERWFPEWVHVLRTKHVKKAVVQATNNEVEQRVTEVRDDVHTVQVQIGDVEAKIEVVNAKTDAQVLQVDRKVQWVDTKVNALSAQMAEVLRLLEELRAEDEAKEDDEDDE